MADDRRDPAASSPGASRAGQAPPGGSFFRVVIREEADVAVARKYTRELAGEQSLSETATEELATAISEIARNIIVHAHAGVIELRAAEERGRHGIVAVARDDGPGISSPEQALEDGYSTGAGLGLGLPSARRLSDELVLATAPARGTTVILTKWSS